MGKINWSINGKNFESFGIKVSASRGLGDDLKQKERANYNWPGRNGKQYNLNSVPKYEERTIELDCFIIGNDWDLMISQFNSFSSEFAKVGTQRFIVEIFSYKPRIYDVILSDKTVLSEVKQEGQSFGTFTVKLVEPEPIKKILYTESTNLQLSFGAPSMVIINIDGKAQQAKGDVSINTNIPKRVVSGEFPHRNFAIDSELPMFNPNDFGSGRTELKSDPTGKFSRATPDAGKKVSMYGFYTEDTIINNYSYSMLVRFNGISDELNVKFLNKTFTIQKNIWTLIKVENETTVNGFVGFEINVVDQYLDIKKLKIEKGNKATDWTPAPENQHYISIAGNIDEITNLNTNAQILWERL